MISSSACFVLGVLRPPRRQPSPDATGMITPADAAQVAARPASQAGLIERTMLFALDRDSQLRARYLRRRWRGVGGARHA